MKEIFQVYINGVLRSVYDIENKEHEGFNDSPKSWWIYMGTLPQDSIIPEKNQDLYYPDLHPYSKATLRRAWEVSIKQKNSCKTKYNGMSFSNCTEVLLSCNEKPIYHFICNGDIGFAMAKAQYLMPIIEEHPFNFFNPEKERGRKIYFYGLPATIAPYSINDISITPDYSTGISEKKWWKELKKRSTPYKYKPKEEDDENEYLSYDWEDSQTAGVIHWGDPLHNDNIKWFRD